MTAIKVTDGDNGGVGGGGGSFGGTGRDFGRVDGGRSGCGDNGGVGGGGAVEVTSLREFADRSYRGRKRNLGWDLVPTGDARRRRH